MSAVLAPQWSGAFAVLCYQREFADVVGGGGPDQRHDEPVYDEDHEAEKHDKARLAASKRRYAQPAPAAVPVESDSTAAAQAVIAQVMRAPPAPPVPVAKAAPAWEHEQEEEELLLRFLAELDLD